MTSADSSKKVGSDALVVGLGYLASFAYPLVSLPFLSRVLGVDDLGQLMFALAVLQIVIYVVDFGFGMSALRGIAVAEDRAERSHVVFSTLKAKVVLWSICAVVLMSLVALIAPLREHWAMYAVGLALIGVGAMYPNWLLQGIGRIKAFAVLTAFSRLVALGLLLLTVRGPEDLVLAMLWQQFPLALSAIASWVMVLGVWQAVERVRTTASDVLHALRDSSPLFISNVATIVLGSTNSVILGIVSVPAQVAYFGASERFSNAVRGVMRGVVDVMLPRMTRDGDSAARLQRFITWGIMATYALAAATLILSAPWLIPWYLGEAMRPAIPILQLMGAALVMVGITTALQLNATAQHRFHQVARIAIIGAAVHIVLLVPAGWLWQAPGAAIALVISEGALALLYILDARSQKRLRSAAATSATAPTTESAPLGTATSQGTDVS